MWLLTSMMYLFQAILFLNHIGIMLDVEHTTNQQIADILFGSSQIPLRQQFVCGHAMMLSAPSRS